MSHAEYAPKQLPVLTRLAIALRRIPAVEFAFAKFKSLLRGRKNDEPVVSEFQAPAADVTKDDGAPGSVEAEAVEPDAVQAASDGTATAAAEPAETDAVEAREIEAPATDVAESATAEAGASEINADEPATTSVCDVVSPAMASDDLSQSEIETVESDDLPVEAEIVEIESPQTPLAASAEAGKMEAPATDVAETATAEADIAAIDADESVTTSVCDVAPPAMASDDLSQSEIEAVESDDLPVEAATAEIESAQTPLVAIAEAGAAEAEKVETVARDADDVAAHVAPSGDSSEAVVAETDVLPLACAETDMIEVDAIETAPFEIKTESEAAQPDAIDPEAVETAPPLIETFETGAVDPDAAETFAAIAVEADVVEVELVEADTIETAPVEAVTAKADIAPAAVAKSDDLCDRETLIRRRWKETGSRMWHGAGQSVLCIQGRIALLPPKPGETMPGYDRLEFRLIDGLIVCEGFVVDPPEPARPSQFV